MERPSEHLSPTRPEAWAAQDADLRTQVRLLATPGDPYLGTAACACGGEWRYLLAEHGGRRLYRCLHCGTLFIGPGRRVVESGVTRADAPDSGGRPGR